MTLMTIVGNHPLVCRKKPQVSKASFRMSGIEHHALMTATDRLFHSTHTAQESTMVTPNFRKSLESPPYRYL